MASNLPGSALCAHPNLAKMVSILQDVKHCLPGFALSARKNAPTALCLWHVGVSLLEIVSSKIEILVILAVASAVSQ